MVTDFGIAKALSGGSGATLTGAGVAIGTPAFMSPEQAAGEREIDGRSDLYSLGIVTYQMLTGELPFNAPTVAGILMKQITEPAPDVRAKRPDVPEDLALAVSRCLEKDPENRWPTRRRAAPRAGEPGGVRLSAHRAPRTAQGQPRGGPRDGAPPHRRAARRPARRAKPPSPGCSTATRPCSPGQAGPCQRARGDARARGRRDAATRRRARPLVPDTGEPRIVQQVRGQFASWAAVSLGCFGINVATGLDTIRGSSSRPSAWASGMMRNYAQLWQSGYSWRDVLTRPPAPDAVETHDGQGHAGCLGSSRSRTADEFGAHIGPDPPGAERPAGHRAS